MSVDFCPISCIRRAIIQAMPPKPLTDVGRHAVQAPGLIRELILHPRAIQGVGPLKDDLWPAPNPSHASEEPVARGQLKV